MVLESTSKIFKHTKAKTFYITVPSSLATDSAFPFKEGQETKIRIKEHKLIIEK